MKTVAHNGFVVGGLEVSRQSRLLGEIRGSERSKNILRHACSHIRHLGKCISCEIL